MFRKLKEQRKKLENDIDALNQLIEERQIKINDLNSQLSQLEKHNALISNYDSLRKTMQLESLKLDSLRSEIGLCEGIIEMQELGLDYTPESLFLPYIGVQLKDKQEEIARLIHNERHLIIHREYKIDGSVTKGRQFQKNYCDNLIIGLDSYIRNKEKSITAQNYQKSVELIESAFEKYNKRAKMLGFEISHKYLDLKLAILQLKLDEKIAKQEEKEKISEEKRKIREQERMIKEAEIEKKKLETERLDLQKLFAKAVTEEEQNEIKNKLATVDKRVSDIDWRISHATAGWLYIATTKSMPGIYKAGVTRRLNPLLRLAEISSASVPFVYECNALVYSDDVYNLEAKLHNRLDEYRVNKINKKKEFFNGNPNDAIEILRNEFHVEVKFINEEWVV